MAQARRLASPGRIDRTRPINFSFNGSLYEGCAGDTLASALLANGVGLVARSFKYHRPRGIVGAGLDEPNAIVDVIVGGIRLPNLLATEIELTEGLEVFSVNAWPSLSFDIGSINNLLGSFLPAGFYYKTFFLPHWHFYEWAIRRAAGLGRLSPGHKTPRVDHCHAHCDVLVVGGGPAGIEAATTAAAQGGRVMLVERDHEPGGSALWRTGAASIEASLSKLRNASNVTILTRTVAAAFHDHNMLMLVERDPATMHQRVWHVRAGEVILATGALERPLVFPGNDRPGIMLASAVEQYINRYAIKPGTRALVVTNNDSTLAVAETLASVGITVEAIVDTRPAPTVARGSPPVISGSITQTRGAHGVTGARIRKSDGQERDVACDLIAMSGGWTPTIQLFVQSGGKSRFDPETSAFVPDASMKSVRVVGSASGEGLPAAPKATRLPGRQKAFVDFQADATIDDLDMAARENFVSVEHAKRYTTQGMSTDQGRTSNANAVALLAAATARPPGSVGTTRHRPPFTPVSVGAFAGHRRNLLYRPQRRTPIHSWHASMGATFEEFGEWLRPAFYGPDREAALRRETLAVRNALGMFDNTPLGKIEVVGPDAARFLDFIYANTMSTLKPGHCRYGLMLNEQGVIIDDGVAARLADDHFWVGTTSAGASRIAAMLDEWLQCEFLNHRVIVTPVTANWAVPTITGPRARDVLAALKPDFDISADAFPHMTFREGKVAGIPVRVFRVSFTGEISYELCAPADRGAELWQALANAAAGAGGLPVGVDAWMVLRTEKGYVHIGTDTDGTTTPDDIGWSHIHGRQGDFVGRRSLLRPANRASDRYQLVGLAIEGSLAMPAVGEHLKSAMAPSEGYVTSAAVSHVLGRPVAMGMVRAGSQRMGETFTLAQSAGRVRIVERTAYDPAGARLHA